MKHTYYENFNEHVYHKQLKNGLNVYLIPKTDFHKTFVTFTTNYGSFDQSFIPIGKERRVNQPAGIAHFLEHKLFAMPDKTDAFEKLSSFGVSANAFTTFDKTSYLFSGTNNVKEALIYLLDFVQTPYFTPASVKKEQGIIEEELLMYRDYPNQRLIYGILGNLYRKHPVNTEVIGTKESIYKITAHKLYQAYHTFYHPSNMVLTLIGNFDHHEMMKLIEDNQNQKDYKKEEPIVRILPKEPIAIQNDETTIEMSVNIPYVGIGVKLIPKEDPVEQYKSEFALLLLLDMYFSQSSDNYQVLLKKGIINQSFNYVPVQVPDALSLQISSMTPDPEVYINEIKRLLVNIKRKTINEATFNRLKKKLQGQFIGRLNNLENINLSFMSSLPYNVNLFEVPALIDSIEIKDLEELAKQIKRTAMTTFTILPKKS